MTQTDDKYVYYHEVSKGGLTEVSTNGRKKTYHYCVPLKGQWETKTKSLYDYLHNFFVFDKSLNISVQVYCPLPNYSI